MSLYQFTTKNNRNASQRQCLSLSIGSNIDCGLNIKLKGDPLKIKYNRKSIEEIPSLSNETNSDLTRSPSGGCLYLPPPTHPLYIGNQNKYIYIYLSIDNDPSLADNGVLKRRRPTDIVHPRDNDRLHWLLTMTDSRGRDGRPNLVGD